MHTRYLELLASLAVNSRLRKQRQAVMGRAPQPGHIQLTSDLKHRATRLRTYSATLARRSSLPRLGRMRCRSWSTRASRSSQRSSEIGACRALSGRAGSTITFLHLCGARDLSSRTGCGNQGAWPVALARRRHSWAVVRHSLHQLHSLGFLLSSPNKCKRMHSSRSQA